MSADLLELEANYYVLQYQDVLNGNYNEELKQNLKRFVIPSLAHYSYHAKLNRGNKLPKEKHKCLFNGCSLTTFASKQKYFIHLVAKHSSQLPDGGRFLAPNDKSVTKGNILCSTCGHVYSRVDKYDEHLQKNEICRKALVSADNLAIEANNMLAIEAPVCAKSTLIETPSSSFLPKQTELLAIEWKINQPADQSLELSKVINLEDIPSHSIDSNTVLVNNNYSNDDDDDNLLLNCLESFEAKSDGTINQKKRSFGNFLKI